MMNLVENFLDSAILTVFIYLLITVIWQWIEKKVTGDRTYVLWHDVTAIVFSVVSAIVLVLFREALIVLLITAIIKFVAQIAILVLIWKAATELIGLRKINKLLKKQIENKDDQIETQRRIIDKLYKLKNVEVK